MVGLDITKLPSSKLLVISRPNAKRKKNLGGIFGIKLKEQFDLGRGERLEKLAAKPPAAVIVIVDMQDPDHKRPQRADERLQFDREIRPRPKGVAQCNTDAACGEIIDDGPPGERVAAVS